ncbi:hypothetical protein VIGAN_01256300, partial [Vigna angularis var. angularis]
RETPDPLFPSTTTPLTGFLARRRFLRSKPRGGAAPTTLIAPRETCSCLTCKTPNQNRKGEEERSPCDVDQYGRIGKRGTTPSSRQDEVKRENRKGRKLPCCASSTKTTQNWVCLRKRKTKTWERGVSFEREIAKYEV